MRRPPRGLHGLLIALLLATTLPGSPTPAWARHSMSFTPGERIRMHAVAGHRRVARRARHASRAPSRSARHASSLTYPAPARFQPQNLRRSK